MHEVHFQKGEVIFTEGDLGEHCYKILSGEVEISIGLRGLLNRNRRQVVATCGPGEYIGDMSLIAGGPRSATATAMAPTVCLAYSSEEVLRALESDPKEALAYVRLLISRIRHSNRRMSSAATRNG
jgi:CRP-like cAMP-binding protein